MFYINPDVPPHFRPSDELLRDHLRQCVLACMKGAGDPIDPEIHLGPGSFNLTDGSWWSTEGGKQLTVELAARLHNHINRSAQTA